ncbi:MAG TPA: Holliday junction branch migration protein RuvA [Patescibacteria group bacterium]|nr:Holliday junction branch migration protein RuvA [Patescibacteria group bacterium]
MIGALEGAIQTTTSDRLFLMTAGGVGYEVQMTANTLAKLAGQARVSLFTHLNVKDDALDLYGFLTRNELTMFKMLISVSGVGPKTAINILNNGIEGITKAVTTADVSFFTQIPKVGKKNAQKIIIELKNKIGSVIELDLSGDSQSETDEFISALVGMGFTRNEVNQLARSLPDEIITIEEKIRFALKAKAKS